MGARHVFHSIYLHAVWHCHGNLPMIDSRLEPYFYEFVRGYVQNLDGTQLLAIGGTANHVHIILRVDPSIAPSNVIGKIKGASAYHINHSQGDNTLRWQRGFGIVSFAERDLHAVQKYVAHQKEHHRDGSVNEVLERAEGED